MEKILVATRNIGKAQEFKALFEPRGYQIETLHDYDDLPEIEETGETFAENARLKAEKISRLTNRVVIGDDSGLMVEALDGAPGIYSARYSGKGHNDRANNKKLLEELEGLEADQRKAKFHTSLAVAGPGKETLMIKGEVEGRILTEARGNNGFGYDPLFFHEESQKSLAELNAEEKNEISHRGTALKNLDREWEGWINNG